MKGVQERPTGRGWRKERKGGSDVIQFQFKTLKINLFKKKIIISIFERENVNTL